MPEQPSSLPRQSKEDRLRRIKELEWKCRQVAKQLAIFEQGTLQQQALLLKRAILALPDDPPQDTSCAINLDQAKAIAVKLVWKDAEQKPAHVLAWQGTTDEGGDTVRVVRSVRHCTRCWIVSVSLWPEGAIFADGPYAVIWLNRDTGEVVKQGTEVSPS